MWRFRLFKNFATFEETALAILKKFDKFALDKYNKVADTADFGLDSLDTVEFVIALEDELKIELTDEEALAITSVGQALNTFNKYKPIP